jgi:hypothetical protein
MAIATLSSALCRFTSVFEKGTGGSNTLWPPGKLVDGRPFGPVVEFGFVVEALQFQCRRADVKNA